MLLGISLDAVDDPAKLPVVPGLQANRRASSAILQRPGAGPGQTQILLKLTFDHASVEPGIEPGPVVQAVICACAAAHCA